MSGRAPNLSQVDKYRIVVAYLKGHKLEYIAATYGTTPSNVCRVAGEYGIRRRHAKSDIRAATRQTIRSIRADIHLMAALLEDLVHL